MIPHVLPTYNRAPIAFEKGEGAWAIATDGSRSLTFRDMRDSAAMGSPWEPVHMMTSLSSG